MVTCVEGASLGQQLDCMKPSNTSDNSQHELQPLNPVALSIGRYFSRSKSYSFMISVEIKPGIIKCHNFIPRAALLHSKDLQ
jgi:hypothetical protein